MLVRTRGDARSHGKDPYESEWLPAALCSPEIVLHALAVVFTEVAAALHFDEGEGIWPATTRAHTMNTDGASGT